MGVKKTKKKKRENPIQYVLYNPVARKTVVIGTESALRESSHQEQLSHFVIVIVNDKESTREREREECGALVGFAK